MHKARGIGTAYIAAYHFIFENKQVYIYITVIFGVFRYFVVIAGYLFSSIFIQAESLIFLELIIIFINLIKRRRISHIFFIYRRFFNAPAELRNECYPIGA